jgi:cell division protease FtsH
MQGYERARTILMENKDALVRIAEALLERESLDAAEIQMLIDGEPLKDKAVVGTPPRAGRDEGEKATAKEKDKSVVPIIPPHENPNPSPA